MALRQFAATLLCGSLLLASSASSLFTEPVLAASAAGSSGLGWDDIASKNEAENPLTSAQLESCPQRKYENIEAAPAKGTVTQLPHGNGDTGFTYAVRAENYDVAEALLKSGRLNVNDLNKFGETPLMFAVFKGQDELFDELIAAGADPQRGGNWTPLHYAATEGRTEFIERLLKAGASANIQTSSGVTPLIMAARKPSRAAVTMLLKAGAYRDYCTDTGQSPADFARRAGDKELAEYLAIPKCAVKGRIAQGAAK